MSPEQKYVWHHELHEKWGRERLYFWRLAFFPTYDREAITEAIAEVMRGGDEEDREAVTSYAIYETLGLYDLVLRVWLPISRNFQDFQDELYKALSSQQLQVIDIFTVGGIARHWPWVKGSAKTMLRPDEALRGEPLPIEELQRGNEAARGNDEATAAEFVGLKLLAPCSKHDGIKFIVVVTATAQLTTMAARDALRNELLRILDDASEDVAGSLYEGSGFGQFLILGGVKEDGFSHVTSDVIEPIIDAQVGAHHGARPYTYVCTGISNPLEFEDVMPVPAEAARRTPPVDELLEQPEGMLLEVKSTALLNLDRWKGKSGDGQQILDEGVFSGGVAKAVVGMLNAEGGMVVIGAVEREKFASADFGDAPERGRYVCIGVDAEYGLLAPDWDGYALALADKLNSAIEPPPTGLISVVRGRIEDRDLAILRVGATSGSWFYLRNDPRLYVRTGNQTRDVSGPTADFYRAAKQRLSSHRG